MEDRAGRLINHTLFTAELLGISEDVLWRLEAIWAVPEEIMRALDDEDAAALATLCGDVETALASALDADGVARGELGSRLVRSDLVGIDSRGRPYVRAYRMVLSDLRHHLVEFREFLAFAAAHRLWLLVE
ncbi:MAG: hypothetical protein ABMB14_01380 [Myxococcota bacterium]